MKDEKEWINKAGKLLKAIKFNIDNPSPGRVVIGGNELDSLNELLVEFERWVRK